MNIEEIITNPPRDEYLDQFRFEFKNAVPVAKLKNLILKKANTGSETHYGLVDEKENLVGYLSLDKFSKDIWVVSLSQLAQAYKGQGFGTFLYDFAVMNDRLQVMSDSTNTGGPHGSEKLWMRLKGNRRYEVVGYDTKTKEIIPNATKDEIYNNKTNTRWLALPPGETINESINRIQSLMKKRHVVWYGIGTTTEDYFNY